MRIIVTGSRDLRNRKLVYWALDRAKEFRGEFTLIHGGCPSGADKYANAWCLINGQEPEVFEADWDAFGKPAGRIRNQAMVDAGADLVLAFPLGTSIGTWDCVNRAKHAGIRTLIFKGLN